MYLILVLLLLQIFCPAVYAKDGELDSVKKSDADDIVEFSGTRKKEAEESEPKKYVDRAPSAKEFRVVKDIPYILPKKPYWTGDLFLPAEQSGPTPTLVVIHGGGWYQGFKEDLGDTDLSRRLAAHGYAVFNINYRLIQDGGKFPYDIQDAKDAICFLETIKDKYNLDLTRLGIYGDSAGGHIALMAAYTPDKDQFVHPHYPTSTLRPKAVGVYFPVTDLAKVDKYFVINYVDDTPEHNAELYASASPISYGATAIPTLLVHGTTDRLVPFSQSQALADELKAKGKSVTLHPIAHGAHGFNEYPGKKREEGAATLMAFFDKLVYGGVPPQARLANKAFDSSAGSANASENSDNKLPETMESTAAH